MAAKLSVKERKRLAVAVLKRHADMRTPEAALWMGVLAQSVLDIDCGAVDSTRSILAGDLDVIAITAGIEPEFFMDVIKASNLLKQEV